jgi:CRP/FNR family transcriptional regulator
MNIACPPDCIKCEFRIKSVFKNLDPDTISLMNAQKNLLKLKKGAIIFQQGESPKGVYCIHKGKIKICRLNVEGKNQIIRLAGEGEIIGYTSLINNSKYSSTAIVSDESLVCYLPQSVFNSMLKKDENFSYELIQMFCTELEKYEKSLTYATQRTVRERLAQCLLFLKETYGFLPKTQIINANFTREEIAVMIGTTRETATRVLYALSNENVIELAGKKLKILDLSQINKIANSNH